MVKGRAFLELTGLSLVFAGFGYMLMKAVTPTPEQTYAAFSPELRRQVDAMRAAKKAKEEAAKQETQLTNTEADKPVWRS